MSIHIQTSFYIDHIHFCKWSFRKTRTMGTLASQAEIGVWIGASTGGASARVRGYDPCKKNWDCICKNLQSGAFWAGKWFAI